jgi:hypothetical protein
MYGFEGFRQPFQSVSFGYEKGTFVLTDPLAVTYDGSAKSLPRVSLDARGSIYRTADGEFEVSISKYLPPRYGTGGAGIFLARRIPDPTPSNVFDDYRFIYNTVGITFGFDALTRAEASIDLPRLRTALLALVDTTLQGRLIAGEK